MKMLEATAVTVVLSAYLHGVAGMPGANFYAAGLKARDEHRKRSEVKPVSAMPTRRRH